MATPEPGPLAPHGRRMVDDLWLELCRAKADLARARDEAARLRAALVELVEVCRRSDAVNMNGPAVTAALALENRQ